MLKVNEYFDGNVKSIGFQSAEGPVTVGAMAVGEYEFGTSQKEIMTVTSGRLKIKLPGTDEWREFQKNETFTVEANQKFQVKVEEESSYICYYK
ncbi:MAG: pyrimidine/purine nucleoside phosphorylase [Dehalococcoidia bacterium]|nr:MAG: pyrimidine/purine nucleoside phosphorylase [Dehalococcoidia bacterium]